jgi:hypothetical protein
MGHFFLAGGPQVALIVGFETAEEGCCVDDIRVGGNGQGLCDFRSDKNGGVSTL